MAVELQSQVDYKMPVALLRTEVSYNL